MVHKFQASITVRAQTRDILHAAYKEHQKGLTYLGVKSPSALAEIAILSYLKSKGYINHKGEVQKDDE